MEAVAAGLVQRGPNLPPNDLRVIDAFGVADRYVMAPSVVEAANGLMTSMSDAKSVWMVVPSDAIWIEWDDNGDELGTLLLGDSRKGLAMLYEWQAGEEQIRCAIYDFLENDQPCGYISEPYLSTIADPLKPLSPRIDLTRFGRLFVAFLAFINSPRIVDRKEEGTAERNKRRRRLNRPPEARQSIITIRPDKREVARKTTAGRMADYQGVCHHKVRRHMRILPSCEITIVRSHWRGDPKLGTSEQLHVVRTAADAGWKA